MKTQNENVELGEVLRADFPIFTQSEYGKSLVYLDNAATSHKPQQVIDVLVEYYQTKNANVHRGVHHLSDESTLAWERARHTISDFFGAADDELIMVRNTTEAINGIAYGWADHNLKSGDVILVSLLEHHSNLVVWQKVAERTGATLDYIELEEDGSIAVEQVQRSLDKHGKLVKLISLAHVSNALGSVVPIADIAKLARSSSPQVRISVDGAQAAPHIPVNFKALGIDFYAFSGHKMLGPMGSGGLLVRKELLQSGEMQPWFFGGGMIGEVSRTGATFHDDPVERFTAGTPDVASAVGLAAACTYMNQFGMQTLQEHDADLVSYSLEKLSEIPAVTIVGPKTNRVGSVTFLYSGIHSHDVAQILDSQNIAVRSGHHCTMPLHVEHNWVATTRASFQLYNSRSDIDALAVGLDKVAKVFGA